MCQFNEVINFNLPKPVSGIAQFTMKTPRAIIAFLKLLHLSMVCKTSEVPSDLKSCL